MKENQNKNVQHCSEAFKRKLYEEYLLNGQLKMSLLRKRHITMKGSIQKWLRQPDRKIFIKKPDFFTSSTTS